MADDPNICPWELKNSALLGYCEPKLFVNVRPGTRRIYPFQVNPIRIREPQLIPSVEADPTWNQEEFQASLAKQFVPVQQVPIVKPVSKSRKSTPTSERGSNDLKPSQSEISALPPVMNGMTDKFGELGLNANSEQRIDSGRVRSPRVKSNYSLTDKPTSRNNSVVELPIPKPRSKFVQAAQTIITKWNPIPNSFSAHPSNLKSANGRNASDIDQKFAFGEFGPKYGDEMFLDFQNAKIKLPVKNYFEDNLFYRVTVTDARSPEHFYMRPDETADDLKRLEESMKEWYDTYWNENANIDPKKIYQGCYYVVYLEDKDWWYRCRVDSYVKEINQRLQVVVQLMDHGNFEVVNQDCLLPLREVYAKLPVQAVMGSIVHTIGNHVPWTTAEKAQFKRDVEGKKFQALVVSQKYEPEQEFISLTVALLETVDGKDIPYSVSSRTNSPED